MTTTSINLQHENIKVSIQVDGIEPTAMKGVFQEAFSAFMKEIEGNSVEDLIANAYMETYKNSFANQEEPQSTVSEEKDNNNTKSTVETDGSIKPVETAVKEEVRNVDTPTLITMEELLKGVDPRAYRNHNGVYRFQVYYICEKCGHKGKAYVEQRPTFCCRECGYTMKLTPATDKPFPFNDEFGNFYVAGKFKKFAEHAKNHEQSHYQFKLEKEMAESDESNRPAKLQVK